MKSFSRLLVCLFTFLISTPVFSLCVLEPNSKLRSAPSTHSGIEWELTRYMPVKKIGKREGWYKIQFLDDKSYWIREDLVTNKFSCAVVKEEYSFLRTGPGREYPKAIPDRVEKYITFRILEEKAGWLRVEDHEGDEFWISKMNVWVQ